MHIICFFHTATIIFYLPILGNQNLHPAYFTFRLGHFPCSANFPPTCLLLSTFRLGHFFPFSLFYPISLLLDGFRLGHFSYSANFPPTCSLLSTFLLGHFSYSAIFPQPACFSPPSCWGISSCFHFFAQSACFSLTSCWSFSSRFHFFTQSPKHMHPLTTKLACGDTCAWLVAPDNPAGFRLHITGTSSPLCSDSVSVIPQIHAFACKQACSVACAWGIITQKSPRAMWSSAGLLEKGVDYKFHVREFMFRCS